MDISLIDAGVLAAVGYGVVFFGLAVLMVVIILVGKAFSKKKKTVVAEVPAPVETAAETEAVLAPGSAGQLKLYDTPPKTAAMVMAIVADKLGKPLNELRFISIKEVK